MRVPLSVLAPTVALALLVLPAGSRGQTGAEVHEGQTLAGELRSGTRDCSELNQEQFEVIGEYAMDTYLGDRSLHEAMNAQMTRTMGASGERAMHVALGHRYTGCPGGPSARWTMPMMGMMDGNGGAGWMHRSSSDDDGTSARAIAAIGLGAALVGGLLVLLGMRFRHGGNGTAS